MSKRIAIFTSLAIALLFGPASAATRDPMQHFFHQSFNSLPDEVAAAKSDGQQAIVIMFVAEDCPWCAKMKATVLNQVAVQDYYRQYFRVLTMDVNGDAPMTDFAGQTLSVMVAGKTYAATIKALAHEPADGKQPYVLDALFRAAEPLHAGQPARSAQRAAVTPDRPVVCAHFRVRGQVQGVFYRASTEAVALRLGLTGWVRNDENGDVELVACGNEQQLQAIEVWLWRGPAEARVSSVQRTQVNRQNFDGFTVNR